MARTVRPVNQAQKYLSPRQAGVMLGVSEFLVYREVKSGNIPSRLVGSRILIPRSWVEGTESMGGGVG